MASSGAMLGSSATCLACLRKLASPLVGGTTSIGTVPILNQTRAKSRFKRPQDLGVVVRLLEDIPKFGRKDAIFRVERGRMRNQWFPRNKAEYMTDQRFQQLKLSRDDIGERDRLFMPTPPTPEGHVEQTLDSLPRAPPPSPTSAPKNEEPIPEPVFKPELPTPDEARTMMLALIPPTLTFLRKPVPASNQPVVTSVDGVAQPAEPSGAIFGSVTIIDIATRIKELLATTPDAGLIPMGPENINIIDLEQDTDRIKSLGTWQVDIYVQGASVTDGRMPIRRTVEVLPEAED